MMEKILERLRIRLDQLEWPSEYMFKFIVPAAQVDQIKEILPGDNISTKESRNGTYISVTSVTTIDSGEKVIKVYREAGKVEGVIAL